MFHDNGPKRRPIAGKVELSDIKLANCCNLAWLLQDLMKPVRFSGTDVRITGIADEGPNLTVNFEVADAVVVVVGHLCRDLLERSNASRATAYMVGAGGAMSRVCSCDCRD